MDDIIQSDVNKTGGLPKELLIFVGDKIILLSDKDIAKGLVGGTTAFII